MNRDTGDVDSKIREVVAVSENDRDITDQARGMLNSLVRAVRVWSLDRKRIRRLVTFKERSDAGSVRRPISHVEMYDRPEIELYLWHRDQIAEMQSVIDTARKTLADITADDPDSLSMMRDCLRIINDLGNRKMRQVDQMEKILAVLSMEQIKREGLMADIASNGARLAQAAAQHRDKMDLAHSLSDIPTADTLRQKLAVKYQISVEEVESILSAKQAESMDGHSDDEH